MAKEYNIGRISLPARISAYTVMITFTILTIWPLCWLFYSSLKLHRDITRSPLALPTNPTFQNFTIVWREGHLGIAFVNSIIYTGIATMFIVILAVAAGYAFAKFNYRITGFFYMFFILGLLVVVHSVLVPLFVMETKLNIDNTRFGVILPYIAFGLPFAVYLATSYIKGIPNALVEAAIIDGASYLDIFWHIILPVSRPIVTTMTIFAFLANWNEFVLVFTLTSKTYLRSLPVGINAFAGGMITDFGLRLASLSVGVVPIIFFYLFFRRQIAKGFAGAAVKE
jgi:raffinose/stachyose/melibiose transport system permease protein